MVEGMNFIKILAVQTCCSYFNVEVKGHFRAH